MTDNAQTATADEDTPKQDVPNILFSMVIKRMLDDAVRVEFPDNPPVDSKGKLKFGKLDELLRFQPLNDLGNAQRLLQRFGNHLIYVEKIGWYGWNGTHWSHEDGARMAEKAAHDTARAMKMEYLAMIHAGPKEGEDPDSFEKRVGAFKKFVNASGNSNRLTAMLTCAQTYLSKQHDELDAHPFLVTVDNGTLNLKPRFDEDGHSVIDLMPHDPKHLISRKMNVIYDPNAKCDKFLDAFHLIMPNDNIRDFLQRFYGYSMSGSVKEQVIVCKHGQGSNGKSLLMGLLDEVFGGYAQSIPPASLMAQKHGSSGSGPTPDLARLPGIRLLKSSEPEAGARFAEGLIKLISGEEKMTVRHLGESFFEFLPQFKLVMSFNTKPRVTGSDDGIWRRILLVPFEQRFYNPEDPQYRQGDLPKNVDLGRQLRDEKSGILNWILDGYRVWQETGLQIPEEIRAATAEYRAESNHALQFLAASCVLGTGYEVNATRVYSAYLLWAKDNAYEPISKNLFGRNFKKLPGIDQKRGAVTNIYTGVRLNQEVDDAVNHTRHDRGGVDEQ